MLLSELPHRMADGEFREFVKSESQKNLLLGNRVKYFTRKKSLINPPISKYKLSRQRLLDCRQH